MDNETTIKSVVCSYRGRVSVYDVFGHKVHDLSGQLTYDKYLEIERRSLPEITEFDGLDYYRCIACDLKKLKDLEEDIENAFNASLDPFTKGLQFSGHAAPMSVIPDCGSRPILISHKNIKDK